MAKRLVTFEVDTNQLFDALKDMQGDATAIGNRLVAALLAEPNSADLLGMAFYGIQIKVNS